MFRNAYKELLRWKKSGASKPLILRGARQVGKTTLLRSFARQEYAEQCYLNFESTPSLKTLFSENLDPKQIISTLSIMHGKQIIPGETLLIFDEIQDCPEALISLKYFCEQAPEYSICAAGSLLGVMLANTKGFPVGKVEFIDLYPMSFSEYLMAAEENLLVEHISDIETISPLPTMLHEKLMSLFKSYLFTGGMPEVVANYLEQGDFTEVRKKQLAILDAYQTDFAKHAPAANVMRISEVWESLPSQLAKENKRFVYSKIKDSARGREYDAALQWLVDAGLIYKVVNISQPKLPLSGYADINAFKIYALDAGLLGALADIPARAIIESDTLFAHFNGAFIENYVAQALKPTVRQLYYWTSSGKAELDYLLQHDSNIIPIEVKSGTSRQKKSLKAYKDKYAPEQAVVISPANLILHGNVLNCPLYLVDLLADKLLYLRNDGEA